MKPFTGAQIKKKSVLGIGNALIDVLITITDDAVLQKFGLPKGSMTLVDAILSAEIKKETKKSSLGIFSGQLQSHILKEKNSLRSNSFSFYGYFD